VQGSTLTAKTRLPKNPDGQPQPGARPGSRFPVDVTKACERIRPDPKEDKRGDRALSEHPTPADLEAFLEDRLDPARVRSLVVHLMQGCESCCLYFAPRLGEVLEVLGAPDSATADGDLYDAAVNQAIEAVRLHGSLALERTRKFRKALARLREDGLDALDHRRFGLYA
jgi:hypothetical protein